MPQNNKIKIRRGIQINLPLGGTEDGELRYSIDSQKLYIDDGIQNVEIGGNLFNFPISTATQTALNAKQDNITLTTTGTSGAATLVGATLNIPQYQSVITNPITGTGTTNYVSKFTGSGSIGDSIIFDNGSSVGIGTATPFRQLDVNGALRLQTGTIDFGNSTNNQIWVASNNINFKTNGSEKAIITSGGYFGVGTSIPSSILHLSGTSTLLTITDNTYGRTSNIGYLDQANLYFANDSNSNTYIGRYNNLFLAYGGGSVGIGTENPLQKLHVNGNILLPVTNSLYFVPTLTTYGIGTPNSSGVQIFTGAGDYIRFGHMSGVDNFTERMRVDGNGNVGIGTTNPAYQLSIEKFGNTYNINPHLAGVDLHSTGNIAPHYQTTYDWYTGAIGSGSFKMRLTNSGDLGIGTTNPQAKLDVLNKVLIGEDLTFGGYYGIGWGSLQNGYNRIFAQSLGGSGDGLFLASASGKGIYFRPNGGSTDALTIAANNYIGINTTAPSYPIHLNHPGSETGILTTFGSANIYLSHGGWGMGANKFGIGNGSFPSIVVNGSNENVGIGTTNPIWKFVVSKGGAAGLEIDPDNGTAGRIGIYAYNRSTSNYLPITFEASSYNFSVGNVGIGTTDPLQKLHVYGNIHMDGSQLRFPSGVNVLTLANVSGSWNSLQSQGINIGDWYSNPAYGDILVGDYNFDVIRTDGTHIFRVLNNGNVGIGTTNPNYTLDVNGFIGATRFYPASSNNTYITGDGNAGMAVVGSGYFYVTAIGGSYFQKEVRFRNIISNDTGAYLQINGGTTGATYFAGTIRVGTQTAEPSAILHLESTTQGFLPPRMSDSEMNAISSPATGLMVWNNDSVSLFVFDGGSWRKIAYA